MASKPEDNRQLGLFPMTTERAARPPPRPKPGKAGGHHCHATACTTACAPEMLMCRRHWYMVPQVVRNAVWRHYRDGQCDDKQPSDLWHQAADAAICAVAAREGRKPTEHQRAAFERLTGCRA